MPLGAAEARELRDARERILVLERELAHAKAMISDYCASRQLTNGQSLRLGLPMLMVDWRLGRDTFCVVFDQLPTLHRRESRRLVREAVRNLVDHEHARLGLASLSELEETTWPA